MLTTETFTPFGADRGRYGLTVPVYAGNTALPKLFFNGLKQLNWLKNIAFICVHNAAIEKHLIHYVMNLQGKYLLII